MNLQTPMGPDRTVTGERWPALDAARGAAIAAMVVYHLAWDLSFVRLIATDVIGHPGWQWFARGIAASFLTLVGIGLVLGHGRRVRWRSFLRRLAVIASAAFGVTIVTWFAFPDEYIFFGILHSIAVSSVLALPFLRVPSPLLVVAAGFCFAAPHLFTDPSLDGPALDWLGLGATTRPTNDYVPIFPWFGFVLLGLVAGRLAVPFATRAAPGPLWTTALSRWLIWSGRRSLPIYLIHQPLLLGALILIVRATGPNPAAEQAFFTRECEESCMGTAGDKARCRPACACATGRLQEEGLWRQALSGGGTAAEQERLAAVTQQCFRAPTEPAPR